METFVFYQDQKVTQWERNRFFVTAESYEKALEYIKSLEGENLFDHEKEDVLEFFDNEPLDDIGECITVEENDGQATMEVLDRDCNVIYDNRKKPETVSDGLNVNVPKNGYVQPTKVRQDVVQGICDVFLDRMPIKCTFTAVRHRMTEPTLYIGFSRKGTPKFINTRELNFYSHKDYRIERIRGCEMKLAFKKLIEAGYHMFKYDGIHYFCSKKPFEQDCKEVTEFNEFID